MRLPEKHRRLTKKGWTLGSAESFLGLTPEESAYIEIKLSLARELKKTRLKKGLSQTALASKLGSSQSRVAKMEGADPQVSLDLIVRSLLATGKRPREIARAVAR
jgi:ribosome-binding protein aMBF1 (putative translation factor)